MRVVLLCCLSLVVISVPSARAQTLYRVTIEQGVNVKMRDNVNLAANIYRPVSDEKFPVLLERTPYNRAGEAAMANELASHGSIVVLQDTRGRSEWQGGKVRRVIRRGNSNVGGDGGASPSRFDLSLRDSIRVLQRMDLPEWRTDAMVH